MTSYKSDLPSALFCSAPSQQRNSPPNLINPPSFSFQISFKASLITTLQPTQMLPKRVRPKCRVPGGGRIREKGRERDPGGGSDEEAHVCAQGWRTGWATRGECLHGRSCACLLCASLCPQHGTPYTQEMPSREPWHYCPGRGVLLFAILGGHSPYARPCAKHVPCLLPFVLITSPFCR